SCPAISCFSTMVEEVLSGYAAIDLKNRSILAPTGCIGKRISFAPQVPKSAASGIVAHLNLSIPCFLCSRTISAILWVFICGLRYWAPPAMAIMVLIFSSTRYGYTTRQGVMISSVLYMVYHLIFVMGPFLK